MDLSKISASNGNGEPVRATVTALRSPGSQVISVDSLQYWPSSYIATSGVLITDSKGNVTLDPSTVTVFSAHTNTNGKMEIDSIAPGYTDKGNSQGDAIVIKPTTLWADTVSSGFSVSHNTDGTLKNGIVSSQILADGSVTGTKIAPGAIILGYASTTSIFTTSSTVSTQVTGLTATVSVPAGGRRVKITVQPEYVNISSGNDAYPFITVWDGPVGTGTQIGRVNFYVSAANRTQTGICIASHVPTAGSHTYNVGFGTNTGTAMMVAETGAPMFMLVELG